MLIIAPCFFSLPSSYSVVRDVISIRLLGLPLCLFSAESGQNFEEGQLRIAENSVQYFNDPFMPVVPSDYESVCTARCRPNIGRWSYETGAG